MKRLTIQVQDGQLLELLEKLVPLQTDIRIQHVNVIGEAPPVAVPERVDPVQSRSEQVVQPGFTKNQPPSEARRTSQFGKKNGRGSGGRFLDEVIMDALTGSRLGHMTVKGLEAVVVANNYNRTSLSPTLTELVRAGKVMRSGDTVALTRNLVDPDQNTARAEDLADAGN